MDDPLTPTWKALADPTRRAILDLLKEKPRTTGELSAAFPLSRFAVIKHIAILEEAGLLTVTPRGRERWHYLNAVPLQRIYERWLRPYEAEWAARLLKLEGHLSQAKGETAMPTDPLAKNLHTIHIQQQLLLQAAPERVFEALTREVSAWWGSPYLQSEAARSISIEPELGGRFFEDWGDGQGSLYAVVTAVRRGEYLELTGPIGMGGAFFSQVVFELEPASGGTSLRLTHHAYGELSDETQANYDSGWQDLIGARLKAFVERGERTGIAAGSAQPK